MIAVANFIGLPLLFLSSTLIAINQVPHWIQVTSRYNPVNWGVSAARQVVLPGTDWVNVGEHVGLLLALTLVMTGLATWMLPRLSALAVAQIGSGRTTERGLSQWRRSAPP